MNERYRQLVEQAPDGIFIADLDGRYTEVNSAGCRMLGYAREEIVGRTMVDLVAPADVARLARAKKQLLQGGTSVAEWTLRCKDGTYLPVEVSAKILPDGRWQSFVRDISERRQIQEKLRASETRYRHLIETLADGFALHETLFDAEGKACDFRYLEVNSAFERLLNLKREQVIGKTILEFLPDTESYWLETFGQVAVSGQPARLEQYGQTFGRYFQITASCPEPGLVAVLFSDVTERRRAEDALRESEARLNQAQRVAQIGSWELNLVENRLAWSDEIYRIFEIDPAKFDASYEAFLQLVHPDDRAAVDFAYRNSVKTGIPYSIDHRLLFPDGRIKYVHEECETVYQDGTPLRSLGTVQETTAHKHVEQALQLYAREQAALAQIGQQAIAVLDVAAVMEDAVRRVAATLDVEYCKVLELLPEGKTLLLRTGVGWKEGSIGKATVSAGPETQAGFTLAGGQPVIVEDLRTETRFDGPPLLHEHGVVSGISVIIGPTDRPYGVMGAHSRRLRTFSQDDVHFLQAVASTIGTAIERRRARDELRRSEERVRLLLESVAEGVYGMDLDGRCTFINPEGLRQFGYGEAGELLGKNLHALVHHTGPDGSPLPAESCRISRAFREGRNFHVDDEMFWRRDGTPFAAEYRSRPMIKDGKVAGAVVTFTDITKRRATERALRESQAKLQAQAQELAQGAVRKDQFIATLAHELRNPLAPIRNAFEIIKRVSDNGAVRSAVAIGERQVAQLVRLVEDLLDVSRITRGKVALRRERVTLQSIVETALETSRPTVETGGQTLTVALPAEPVLLDADPTRMAQAISNLVINASKFSERNGEIRLTARRDGDELTIAVQDNGIGIEPALLPLVFDLFMQAETKGRQGNGLGIGLPLVRSLLELHGGRVEAASPGLGKGATFTIHLPLAPASVALEPPSPVRVQTEAAPSAPRRILVVDDDGDVVRSATLLLQSYGHEVYTAGDGARAIATALEQRPDFVLLDIGLPDMDGYEVACRLRAEPRLRDTRLIAITGQGQDGGRKWREAGFARHFLKPIDPATLEAIVCEPLTQTATEPAEPAEPADSLC